MSTNPDLLAALRNVVGDTPWPTHPTDPYDGPEPDDGYPVSDSEADWAQRRADGRNADVFGVRR